MNHQTLKEVVMNFFPLFCIFCSISFAKPINKAMESKHVVEKFFDIEIEILVEIPNVDIEIVLELDREIEMYH